MVGALGPGHDRDPQLLAGGPGTAVENGRRTTHPAPGIAFSVAPAVTELRLTFTLRAQDVGPIDAELENRGGYRGTDQLPLPGTWTMKITVRTTDIDQVTLEKDVRVGQPENRA
ncbi:hypothetical protein [Streptomyces sp. TRM70350]|uniref:hypothetical protein n=1 Tax=Streptomyces sp. TRM70350 TaxID=2856165 RepID=UPI0035A862B4